MPGSAKARPRRFDPDSSAEDGPTFLARPQVVGVAHVFGGEFRAVTNNATDEESQDSNHAHFTASLTRDRGPATIAEASKPSIRKFFVDKTYGVFGRDTVNT